jgi:hypothetical protein
VGNNPSEVVTADFNGDGHLDLAVANRNSWTISILLGNGDGTFRAGSSLNGTGYLVALAVADLNGDGKADLIAPDYYNHVDVFLGNGDGTFQSVKTFAVGDLPSAVAVGDFNGDGIPDIVSGNSGAPFDYASSVSVLLGNGDGTFQPAKNYSTTFGTNGVAVGDLNNDGILDLVSADSLAHGVSVLLGNGDGTFRSAVPYHVDAPPNSVVLADLTNDGKLDAVVGTLYGSAVTVLPGVGDGTFKSPETYNTGYGPAATLVADLNGDGLPDLVSMNASGTITVSAGIGGGAFLATPSYDAGMDPTAVVTGDFTNDQIPDLAVTDMGNPSQNQPSSVSILTGHGDGSFHLLSTFAVGLGDPAVAVGDFNGDGNLDLAVTNSGFFDPFHQDPGGLTVFLGNGDGTFGPPHTYPAGTGPESVVVADVNGDGHPDLVVGNGSKELSVLLGNGDGTFQAPRNSAIPDYPKSLVTGDFNNDGFPDLAIRGANDLYVLLGNGDGTFQPAVKYSTDGAPRGLVVGDLNGDGQLDLAATTWQGNSADQISVLLGNGDGTFQPAVNSATPPGPAAFVVADSNGDGTPDLAVLTAAGLSILFGNGDGTFQPGPTYASGHPNLVATGDFNGDGLPDVVATDYGTNAVWVFLNAADGGAPAVHSKGMADIVR